MIRTPSENDTTDGTERTLEITERRGPGRPRKHAIPDAPEEKEDKITELFRSLGGAGRILVYRIVDGEYRYAKSLVVESEGFQDHLDETIALACGGGTYYLKFHAGSKNLGGVRRSIDEGAFPPKATQVEMNRNQPPPGTAQPTVGDLSGVYERANARAKDEARMQTEQQEKMFMLMLKMQEDANLRQLQLIQAMSQLHAPQAQQPQDLAKVLEMVKIMQSLGFQQPGSGGIVDNKSMVERILETTLAKTGETIVNRVMDAQTIKPALPPSSVAGAAPPTPRPQAGGVPSQPAHDKAPPPAPASKVFHRLKPLTPDQVQAMKERAKSGIPNLVSAPTAKAVLTKDGLG